MENQRSDAESEHDEHQSSDHHAKKVRIEVDNHTKEIRAGVYLVSKLKELIGVPAEKDLDQVINGTLTPLDDTAKVIINGGEVFFSHVRRGGSS